MNRLPCREALVGSGVPVRLQLVWGEEAHLTTLRGENACLDHAGNARVLSLGKRLGHAIRALRKPRLLEPRQRPAAVGIKRPLLLGQRLVESLVNERQCIANGERLAIGVEYLGITSVNRHARADG